MKSLLIFFVVFSCTEAYKGYNSIGCFDEDDSFVDWYYAYKLPKASKSKPSQSGTGSNYAYITAKTDPSHWILSDKLVNYSESIMGRTLRPIYEKIDRLLIILYSDQPPNKDLEIDFKKAERGHTKGVVVANKRGGFWLVHSVPKYPPSFEDSQGYNYPNSGTMYGQSFLCISLRKDQLKKVGTQLIFNEPGVYAYNIPKKLESMYPELVEASKMGTIKSPPYYNIENLMSYTGANFTSFAKAGKFKKELYEDLVAPTLGDDLYVEGWRKGPGNLDSDCSKETKVYNIEEIGMLQLNVSFKTTSDHSKWQVTSEDEDWICVGDINRQRHQAVRGGGTVCRNSPEISLLYRNSIVDTEPCKKPERRSNFIKVDKKKKRRSHSS